MNTTTRTLRLRPADVMTGDLLLDREAFTNRKIESVVCWVEQSENKRNWSITTLNGAALYASQRRLTVKRSGPKGFGE